MLDSLPGQLSIALLGVVCLMAALWWQAQRTRNAGIVDVGWTVGVGAVGLFLAATTPGELARRWLIGGMLGVWSFRLAAYIFINRVWNKPEDGRYQNLRKRWGEHAGYWFFWFFEVQSLLVIVFVVPATVVLRGERGALGLCDWLGLGVWCIAVAGESLADWQLARWRADPVHRGRTCRAGLWRYSRHPNYFFEWLHWWAYVVMAVGLSHFWWTLLGPGLMLLFLYRITGIPATEAQAVASRGEDYRRYQRSTSAFFPLPPRKEDA